MYGAARTADWPPGLIFMLGSSHCRGDKAPLRYSCAASHILQSGSPIWDPGAPGFGSMVSVFGLASATARMNECMLVQDAGELGTLDRQD